jgi:hypothetical protein
VLPGGLIAVLGGVVAGAGLYVLAKNRAAPQGPSACETACIAAAQAKGATGDLTGLCRTGCGILGNPVGAAEGLAGTITSISGALGRLTGLTSVFGGGGTPQKACPPGAKKGNVASFLPQDHRTGATTHGKLVWGCIDRSTTPPKIWTYDKAGNPTLVTGFAPVGPPPPIVPQPSIVSTTTNSLGGTNTQRDHRTP